MREMRIMRWCDLCYLEGKSADQDAVDGGLVQESLIPVQVEATESYVASCAAGEDKRPSLKMLDLCERHGKTFKELAELLGSNELAFPAPSAPAAAPGAAPKLGRPPGSGVTTPERATCPVCKVSMAYGSLLVHIWNKHRAGETKPEQPRRCPECKEPFEPQGMSVHRKTNHGVDPLIEALRGVQGYVVTGREREEL